MRSTALLLALMTAGCAATHDRPMNLGERTHVSPNVAQLVADAPDAAVDIRDRPEIRCTRFKRVGTHMVSRHCYTVAEAEASEGETRAEMQDRFGKQQCLNRSLACRQGSSQDPLSRGPGGPRVVSKPAAD
ncbi:MAG: hypothetical protein AAGE01_10650 [Pseudomonadota bacterium]